MTFRLVGGDAIEAMQAMAENSVDAIVTDPPYGLEFMGKEWDKLAPIETVKRSGWADDATGAGINQADKSTPHGRTGVAFHKRRATAVCSGCGKRDAFRNDHACTDDAAWAHEWTDPLPVGEHAMQAWHHAWATEALRILKPGGHLLAFGGTRTYHRLACAIEDAGFEIRDCIAWMYGSGFPKSLNIGDGYGTALKPAFEPIVLARKPLAERNVAANVQRWGTGALNIDGTRIEAGAEYHELEVTQGGSHSNVPLAPDPETPRVFEVNAAGRWPANVTLDETAAAMLDEQTGERLGFSGGGATPGAVRNEVYGQGWLRNPDPAYYGDTGGASRFYYCPKADREERNRGLGHMAPKASTERHAYDGLPDLRMENEQARNGSANHHPTVKPVELMRWLCRMVTPKGGTVLDPFAGSGSTGVAAMREGFEFIGIEREAEYVEIARARIIGDAPLFNVEAGGPTE